MSNRKIILYPKSAMKPIILTDSSDQTTEQLQTAVEELLNSNKISVLKTTNDSLVVRPSEIQAVLITHKDESYNKPDTKYTKTVESNDDNSNS